MCDRRLWVRNSSRREIECPLLTSSTHPRTSFITRRSIARAARCLRGWRWACKFSSESTHACWLQLCDCRGELISHSASDFMDTGCHGLVQEGVLRYLRLYFFFVLRVFSKFGSLAGLTGFRVESLHEGGSPLFAIATGEALWKGRGERPRRS